MARVHSNFPFLGTIDNLTAYRIMGSDEVYIRRKAGPSSSVVKKSAKFVNFRRAGIEFGGRAAMTSSITPILGTLKHIINFPVYGKLGALKPVQNLDTSSKKGERNIFLSKQPQALEGFNLNKRYAFESIIRNGFSASITKDAMYADVSIPTLVPGNNLYIPDYFDWYKVNAVLGVLPDYIYTTGGYQPIENDDSVPSFTTAETSWCAAKEGSAATKLELALPPTGISAFSLMLIVGVSFGKVAGVNHIEAVKHVGAAKIVATG